MRQTLFTLLLVLVSVPAWAQSKIPAPSVVLRDLKGRSVRLADFKGKVVLLNFWATWCPPCRAEIPDLVKWQEQYGRQGLQVIGVTYPPTNRRTVRTFVRKMKMNYPVLLGSKTTKALFDPGETLPFSVVLDREGNVRATIEGILLPEEFEEKIRPLLVQSTLKNVHHSKFHNQIGLNGGGVRMQNRHISLLIVLAFVMTFGAVVASAATATVTIRVEGMHCGGCAESIKKKLKATAGVEDVRVSFEKKEAWVKFDDQKISVAQLREVIKSTGFKTVDP